MIYANSFSQFNEANSTEPEEPSELSWYYGIADCHGLESFIKEPKREVWTEVDFFKSIGVSDIGSAELDDKKAFNGKLGMMKSRCRANMQRHPVIYRVLMEPKDADMVQDQLARRTDAGYIMGLTIVKAKAKGIPQLISGSGGNSESPNTRHRPEEPKETPDQLKKKWAMIPNPDLEFSEPDVDPMHR
jgi:hypothetical protein